MAVQIPRETMSSLPSDQLKIPQEQEQISNNATAISIDDREVSTRVENLEVFPEIEAFEVDDSAAGVAPEQNHQHSEDRDGEYPSGSKFYMTLMAAFLSLTIVGLDLNILATAIPSITTEFKTIADIGWYSSAYRLPSCAFQLMFARVYKLFSIKSVFLTSILIFEAGSLVAGLARSSSMLIVGRAIAGFGCAGILAGLFVIIGHTVPLHRRPIANGFAGAVEGVSSAAGPVLGGVLTQHVSWRWCFFINIPLGAFSAFIIALIFHNPERSATNETRLSLNEKLGKLDLCGTAFFVPSTTLLLLALQWGGTQYGWSDWRIILCFVSGVVLLIAFVMQQRRMGEDATLPKRILQKRSLLAGCWFSMCNNSVLSVVDYYMPSYFQVVHNLSTTTSGLLCLPIVIACTVGLLLAGPLTSKIGYYTPSMILTSVLTPVAAGLLTTLKTDSPIIKLLIYQSILGFFMGIGCQAPQTGAQAIFPDSPSDASMGIAMVIFAQNFGPAIFVPVAQTIFSDGLSMYLTLPTNATSNGTSTVSNPESGGLLDLRKLVSKADLPIVLAEFDRVISQTFYLAVALACATVLGTVAMEWKSVKVKKA